MPRAYSVCNIQTLMSDCKYIGTWGFYMGKEARSRYPFTNAIWSSPATEDQWHALRRNDVTATDAAALFGVSPYCTPFELFHRKAGNVSVQVEETEQMMWGKRLQPAIAAGLCADHGWRIISLRHPWLYVQSLSFPGMGASPDYVIHCPVRGVGLLEIKNVDWRAAKDGWSDEEAPVHYEFQLQHQLECSGLGWGAIGGLVGGNEGRVFVRDRDREVGAEIGNRVTDLWRRVKDNDPPPPNYAADLDTIKRLYRDADVGSVMDPTPEVSVRLAELAALERAANARKKVAEDDQKTAQAEILDIMREHERAAVDGFKISAVTIHTEERTQTVRASSYRRLTVTAVNPKN